MSEGTETGALDRFAIALLQPKGEEGEGYAFQPKGPDILKQGIEALLNSDANPKEPLESLLKVAFVLREQENSPEAAETILQVLASVPAALRALGIASAESVNEAKERFAQFAGGKAGEAKAAHVQSDAPEGSLKLSSLVQPGRGPAKARPANKPSLKFQPKSKDKPAAPKRTRRIVTDD